VSADTAPTEPRLDQRVVLITGAYGGLGRALSLACAQRGATVVLLGRSMPHLERLYDELEEAGAPQTGIIPLDLEVAAPKDYAALATMIEEEFGQLHALVHCAAALGTPMPLSSYDMSHWTKAMATNLHGPVLLTQAMLPLLEASDAGSVVFTLDDHDTAYWGAYGVSKAAIRSFATILADETENRLNADGYPRVAVHRINPGPMRTPLRTRAFPGELPTEVPLPETRVDHFLPLIARTDRQLTATDVRVERDA